MLFTLKFSPLTDWRSVQKPNTMEHQAFKRTTILLTQQIAKYDMTKSTYSRHRSLWKPEAQPCQQRVELQCCNKWTHEGTRFFDGLNNSNNENFAVFGGKNTRNFGTSLTHRTAILSSPDGSDCIFGMFVYFLAKVRLMGFHVPVWIGPAGISVEPCILAQKYPGTPHSTYLPKRLVRYVPNMYWDVCDSRVAGTND